jgi:hypothetical protein
VFLIHIWLKLCFLIIIVINYCICNVFFFFNFMIYLGQVSINFSPSGHVLENMKSWEVAVCGCQVPSLTEVCGNNTVLTEWTTNQLWCADECWWKMMNFCVSYPDTSGLKGSGNVTATPFQDLWLNLDSSISSWRRYITCLLLSELIFKY